MFINKKLIWRVAYASVVGENSNNSENLPNKN